MKINTFVEAQKLWATTESSDVTVIVSDINYDDQITEGSFEAQCEWRRPYRSSIAEPIDKPAGLTWAVIESYESDAAKVADYEN